MAAAARALKEQFYRGHHGTTFTETVCVSSVIISAVVCYRGLLRLAGPALRRHPNAVLLVEGVVVLLPVLLAFTFTELTLAIHGLCLGSAGVFFALARGRTAPAGPAAKPGAGTRLPFLDEYRAMLMLATCISILAVDFTVFPRRFAKTEMYGVSVMDVGVGTFVFSNSLIYGARQLQEGVVAWRRTLASFAPLLVLGLLRLVAIKGTDYHEVTEEYGLHWNFFFTLAGLPVLSAVAASVPGLCRLPSAVTGGLVLGAYQFGLSRGGGAEYIADPVRHTLVDANKEGLLSLWGYFGVYCIGAGVGRVLFRAGTAPAGKTVWQRLRQPQVVQVWA